MGIICLNCGAGLDLLESLDANDICIAECASIHMLENEVCSLCDEHIINQEGFTSKQTADEFISWAIKKLAVVLSKKIIRCQYCNIVKPKESKKDFEEDICTEMGDFLYDNNVPEIYRDEVVKHLYCDYCWYGYDAVSRSFTFYDDIFLYDIDEPEYKQISYDEHYNGIAKYIEVEPKQIKKFSDYLKKFPMLGMKTLVGKKIFSFLKQAFKLFSDHMIDDEISDDDAYEMDQFIYDPYDCVKTLYVGTKLFRGRTRKKDTIPFISEKLWAPENGMATHGRFNLIGISVLYCTSEITNIPYELKSTDDELIDIGTFILQSDFTVLDVSADAFKDLFGFLEKPSYDTRTLKEGYLIPNFICDCCRQIGYQGIIYNDVRTHKCPNYAFFNLEKNKDIKILPQIETMPNIFFSKMEKLV